MDNQQKPHKVLIQCHTDSLIICVHSDTIAQVEFEMECSHCKGHNITFKGEILEILEDWEIILRLPLDHETQITEGIEFWEVH